MTFKTVATIALLFFITASARAEEKPDPRENLDTAIAEMIRLIEAKDTVSMLKTFVPPKELQRMLENKTIEELAKDMEPRLPLVLKMLKLSHGTKPRLENMETEATYELQELIGGSSKVTFRKVEKLWYVR